MHSAPTVSYPVGRSRFQAITFSLAGIVVVAVDAAWFYRVDVIAWRQWFGLGVTLLAAVVLYWAWRRSPEGTLSWDGRSWWWEFNGIRAGGVVKPQLDLQNIVLLSFDGRSGSRHWFWIEQIAAKSSWHAMRRAVHARAQADNLLVKARLVGAPSANSGTEKP